jgi:hypothetical protein
MPAKKKLFLLSALIAVAIILLLAVQVFIFHSPLSPADFITYEYVDNGTGQMGLAVTIKNALPHQYDISATLPQNRRVNLVAGDGGLYTGSVPFDQFSVLETIQIEYQARRFLITSTYKKTLSVEKTGDHYRLVSEQIGSNVFAGKTFYNSHNTQLEKMIRISNSKSTADLFKAVTDQPRAEWLIAEDNDVDNHIRTIITEASRKKEIPVFVVYQAARFDCKAYYADKNSFDVKYLDMIRNLSRIIGSLETVVILEPDALGSQDCLAYAENNNLIGNAVDILKIQQNTHVYIDAGHGNWIAAVEMSRRLTRAGIERADGFSLNVSNFISTDRNIEYGMELSSLLGGKHFIIDTSRNGNGPSSTQEWCNPRGRALGQNPTTETGHQLVDAFLWIKNPGESDGKCNGGPAEGQIWREYLIELIANRNY